MKKLILILSVFLSVIQVNYAQLRYNYSPYTVQTLQNYPLQNSPITITQLIQDEPLFTTYSGYYTTMQRKMSLFIGVPKGKMEPSTRIVVLLRDFQPHYNYTTGQAILEVAEQFLLAGFVVIAPDFFGFGDSEEAPMGAANSAESYLIMPINASELYLSLKKAPIILSHRISPNARPSLPTQFTQITFWGEGVGGYVAIQSLMMLREPIPTILWSPVTTNFAQAWAFFRAQYSSVAGKSAEKFLYEFQRFYNPAEFSILDNLRYIAPNTPIRLHHGQKNETIPILWSQQFVNKVGEENQKRKQTVTPSILLTHTFYPNAQANLMRDVPSIANNDIGWLNALRR